MIRSISFLFVLAIFAPAIVAQDGSNQDPQAKKILQKLSEEYKVYNTMEVSFNLVLDLPDQAPETQKGTVIQKGDKYFLDLKDQAIYCNGKYVWLHLKDNNEVQINDLDEDAEDSFLTPRDMMTIYESDDYNYAVIGSEKKNGRTLTLIEFKPTNPDSEYSKLRLSVDTKKNRMSSMEVFSKDGSKYILTIDKVLSNKDYIDAIFAFDASRFPGIHVEDLRL
jgi:outer membrane lipoprotein-sorting protein